MAKYLDNAGLTYFWGKIKAWVGNYVNITSSTGKDTIKAGTNSVDIYDWAQQSTKPTYTANEVGAVPTTTTVNGHALSGNVEVTASDIGVASGAEVNQNAFSNVKVGSTTIAADSKTDTLELVAGSNGVVTLTPDATNDKVTVEVTTDLSQFDNSTAGFITSADVPEGAAASTTTPVASDGGAGATGSETAFARGDHKHPSDSSKVNTSSIGAANGVCPLDANTKIDSQYLPSYVDDVIEAYARTGQTALSSTWLATGSASGTAITPEAGKIYVLMADSGDYTANSQFRWGGTTYVKLNDGGVSAITNSEIDTITAN